VPTQLDGSFSFSQTGPTGVVVVTVTAVLVVWLVIVVTLVWVFVVVGTTLAAQVSKPVQPGASTMP